jgi:hypothetical protein
MVELVFADTAAVEMLNVAEDAPEGTVTDAETEAGEVADRPTTVPPLGAGALSVTVPVDDTPPRTDVGETVTLLTANGLSVRVAVAELD